MIRLYVFVYLLCSLWRCVNAAGLSSSPTPISPSKCNHEVSKVTSPPRMPFGDELRRRQDTLPVYYCGYSSTIVWQCNVHSYACKASIYGNGDAYQYCSDANLGTQIVFTTAASSWRISEPCPTTAGTVCWYAFAALPLRSFHSNTCQCRRR